MVARSSGRDVSSGDPQLCRLLIDPPALGAWNMAVDEALLDAAVQGVPACLRFYQWSEPTLSLGYFQRHAERRQHTPSLACSLVRRSSGGGAILHDHELTYSLILPAAQDLARHAESLYLAVHQALIEALASYGVTASLNAQASGLAPDEQPFLCFQRGAAGDVLLVSAKIAGSAAEASPGHLATRQHLVAAIAVRAGVARHRGTGERSYSSRRFGPPLDRPIVIRFKTEIFGRGINDEHDRRRSGVAH